MTEKILYEWRAPEFSTQSNGVIWGWWIGIGALAMIGAWSVWTKEWVALAVVGMIVVVAILMRQTKPRDFGHQLTEAGVKVGEALRSYDQFRAFWIVLENDTRVVNLLPSKKWGLMLTLQLGDANVDKVRETLLKFLPEDASRGEDTIDKIGRFFRL
ncbi:MAG: hypothetical protein WC553_02730 [Patescibacteria group bacterium]|jgi:hypothetical protein